MRHHQSKLERATVVAGFDTQDGADEALLELRAAGLTDRRIGYFSTDHAGRMVDLLADHHRPAAAVIGAVAGAAVGVGAVYLLHRVGAAGPDPIGLAATLGVCGALLLGTLGWLAGLKVSPDDEPAPADDPFLMTVEAGDRGRVWEVLRRRGGHEPHAPPAVIPAHLPM